MANNTASNIDRYIRAAHLGYMTGLRGEDPDKDLERDSEYVEAWLLGCQDREAGVTPDLYSEVLPEGLKRGCKVRVKAGAEVKTIYHGTRIVPRNYVVKKVHDVYPMAPAYFDNHGFNRPTPAKIVWPGTGGYWSDTAVSNVEVVS
jgi:hypothetical protein